MPEGGGRAGVKGADCVGAMPTLFTDSRDRLLRDFVLPAWLWNFRQDVRHFRCINNSSSKTDLVILWRGLQHSFRVVRGTCMQESSRSITPESSLASGVLKLTQQYRGLPRCDALATAHSAASLSLAASLLDTSGARMCAYIVVSNLCVRTVGMLAVGGSCMHMPRHEFKLKITTTKEKNHHIKQPQRCTACWQAGVQSDSTFHAGGEGTTESGSGGMRTHMGAGVKEEGLQQLLPALEGGLLKSTVCDADLLPGCDGPHGSKVQHPLPEHLHLSLIHISEPTRPY